MRNGGRTRVDPPSLWTRMDVHCNRWGANLDVDGKRMQDGRGLP